MSSWLAVGSEVEAGELNRAQVLDVEGVSVGVDVVVGDDDLRPDAPSRRRSLSL
jgi:hypothetical protein